jgi:5S rRNA maturation endonuclease (ribonuclease M5)
MLNKTLYDALTDAFGQVAIANADEALVPVIRRDAVTGRARLDKQSTQFGEYYRVCCPMCRDGRHRLWVNHAYGTEVEGMGTVRGLVVCYNEHCEQEEGFFDWFESQLAGYTRTTAPIRLPTVLSPVEPRVPGMPLDFTPLHCLYDQHPARQYIESRGFSAEDLGVNWSIGWSDILEPYYRIRSRIVIPTYVKLRTREIMLYGWQARYLQQFPLSDVPPDKDTKKYINAPGMKKAQTLFNAWRVDESPFVVVTEGPFDAIRVGPRLGVALFGKSASASQKRMLWDIWGANKKPIIVMLDPDAEAEGEDLYTEFSRYTPLIYKISLPPGKDAAKMPQDLLLNAVAQAIAAGTNICLT